MTLFHSFPYLGLTLFQLLVFLVGSVVARRQRRAAVVSGLFLVPFSLASLGYVPDYWDPVRVVVFLKTGLEDVWFCFGTGGLIWLWAFGPDRARVELSGFSRPAWLRFLGIAALGVGVALFGISVRVWTGLAALAAIGIVGVLLAWFRRDLLGPALRGGFGYAFTYQVSITLAFRLWPHFRYQWNLSEFSGIQIAGVPIEETLWAGLTGFTWILFLGYVLSIARISHKPSAATVDRTPVWTHASRSRDEGH